jgi:hypothetical protein
MPETGALNFLLSGKSIGLNDGAGEAGNQHASHVAVGHGLFSIGNLAPFNPIEPTPAGIDTYAFGGGSGSALKEAAQVDALGYTRSHLIAGEEGPQLEVFAPGQVAPGSGLIDLTQPPTSIPPGGGFTPSFIETIYSLGPFVYVGIYGSRTVELLDAEGSPLHLMARPFVAGEEVDATVTSMAGFLSGTPSVEPAPKGPGAGSPGPGGPSGATPKAKPAAIVISGAAKGKLGSGGIKVKVTCGLPCTIAGAIVPPGAKFARRAKALPFKTVKLPGTGRPVTVTLRFTRAQRLYARAQLRRHRKVKAIVRVTEGAGGAAPSTFTIRIV